MSDPVLPAPFQSNGASSDLSHVAIPVSALGGSEIQVTNPAASKYRMRIYELFEAIRAPHALSIKTIILQAIAAATDPSSMRQELQSRLTAVLQHEVEAQASERQKPCRIAVHVVPSTKDLPAGGAFRGDPEEHEGLLPSQPNVMDVFAFVDDDRLESWLDPQYRSSRSANELIENLATTIQHEFVHGLQYRRSHAKKFGPLARYTIGRKREKVNGTRHGKRGGYTNGWTQNKQQYLGQDIEIDAHAAQAAADIIFRAQREPVGQQATYAQKVLRNLHDNSAAISSYRDAFQRVALVLGLFGGSSASKSDPRIKQQKAQVWKMFKRKVAQHLTDYLDQLDTEQP